MELELILKKIDNAAIMWNKAKDPYYKALWYDLLKEFNYGRASIFYSSSSIGVRRNGSKRNITVYKDSNSV